MAAALRKAGRLLPLLVLAPAVLAVRALRRRKLIRFGTIFSHRVGHLGIEPELHLLLRQAGVHPRGALDLFSFQTPVANRQLARMWSRVGGLHVWQLSSSWLDWANRVIPGGEFHQVPSLWDFWSPPMGALSSPVPRFSMRSAPYLSFNPDEERRGRAALREMGLEEGAQFVCFNAREAGFLNTVLPARDWRYHDYRDSNIQHYVPAIEALTRRGYWGIRMGALVTQALDCANPRIVDYAMRSRTDFMDVFLGATCRFFVNDTSGIMSVPMAFRRPMVLVNVIPIGAGFRPYDFEDRGLFIPKLLRRRSNGRLLTFREILGSEVGRYSRAADYERDGIDVLENTPEEILAVTLEMADRLDGQWQPHPDDDELHQRFLSILSESGYADAGPCRPGAAFLREHRALLH